MQNGKPIDIPGYYYDPERRRHFKIAGSSTVRDHQFRLDNIRAQAAATPVGPLYKEPRAAPSLQRALYDRELGAAKPYSRVPLKSCVLSQSSFQLIRSVGARAKFVRIFPANNIIVVFSPESRSHVRWSAFALKGYPPNSTIVVPSTTHLMTNINIDVSDMTPLGRSQFLCIDNSDNQSRCLIISTHPQLESVPQFIDSRPVAVQFSCCDATKDVLAAANSETISIYDRNSLKRAMTIRKPNKSYTFAVRFGPEPFSYLVGAGSRDSFIRVYDQRSSRAESFHMKLQSSVCDFQFLYDGGPGILASTMENGLQKWDMRMLRNAVDSFGCHVNTYEIHRLGLSPDRRFVALGGSDARVRVWDVRSGQYLRQLELPESPSAVAIGDAYDRVTPIVYAVAQSNIYATTNLIVPDVKVI